MSVGVLLTSKDTSAKVRNKASSCLRPQAIAINVAEGNAERRAGCCMQENFVDQ